VALARASWGIGAAVAGASLGHLGHRSDADHRLGLCRTLALVLGVVGAQRMRFRLGSGGPGVVQVTEGQISYFGPLTGGAVARSEIETLRLDHTARPSHWVLEQPGQSPLAIPVTAAGAEALFDVFASLPGLKTERMLSELHHKGPHQVVIWQRSPEPRSQYRLH